MSRALVVVQIALCLAVVFAAGLLTRTLATLATVDLGFEPGKVIALRVDPAATAVACARVMRGVLFGVTATDAPTLVAGILLLGGVALLATAAPLRRATRVDPMVALRSE